MHWNVMKFGGGTDDMHYELFNCSTYLLLILQSRGPTGYGKTPDSSTERTWTQSSNSVQLASLTCQNSVKRVSASYQLVKTRSNELVRVINSNSTQLTRWQHYQRSLSKRKIIHAVLGHCTQFLNPEVLRRARIDQMLFILDIMMKYNG